MWLKAASVAMADNLASLSEACSLPSTFQQANVDSEQQVRVFSRAVSERVKQAVAGMQHREEVMEAQRPDIEVPAVPSRDELLSPRKGGQRRRKSPKRARNVGDAQSKIRYTVEDSATVNVRKSRDFVSPVRRVQPTDVRRSKTNSSTEARIEEQILEVSREVIAAVQQSPVAVKIEPQELNVGEEARAGGLQRQFKQRAADMFASLSFSSRRNETTSASPPKQRQRRARRAETEEVTSQHRNEWLQLLEDVLMWRNFARSTFVFGIGCFCMLSASFTKDIHFNIVTAFSYAALAYLSLVFFRQNMINSSPSQSPVDNAGSWKLNEAAAIEVARRVLPAVNAVLLKLSHLFSGDPATTLRVASALWVLAQSGYWVSFGNLLRLAFLGAFIVPKCYSSYSKQIREQGEVVMWHALCTWDGCSHKKLFASVMTIVAWNLFSLSSRLWIGFVVIVAVRQYHNQHQQHQLPNEDMIKQES